MGEPRWLLWSRQLHALAQTGLAFSRDPYDRERYEQLRELASNILAEHTRTPAELITDLFSRDDGYATPKIDVRAAVFDAQRRLLMVREVMDQHRWTLPGGWADVNDTPAYAVEKEIEQESGFTARAVKVAAVYDRNKQGHPYYLFHSWKIFFICEITGGAPRVSYETDGVDFFDVDALPELSLSRSTEAQIRRMLEHHRDRSLPTDFD